MPQQLWVFGYLYQPKSTPLTGSGEVDCPHAYRWQESGHKGPLSAKVTSKGEGNRRPKDGEWSGTNALTFFLRAAEWPPWPPVGQTYLQEGRKSQRPGPAESVLDSADL